MESSRTRGSPATSERTGSPGGVGVVQGFIPWIIFWVVSDPSTWEWAALGALIAAVILAIPDAQRPGGIKLLDLGTIAFFAVISILALVLDRSDLDWLERYAQAISSGALAVIAFGSLALTPFTEQYARDSVPREFWNSMFFKQINRLLTLMWGVVFTLTAVSGILAVKGSHSTNDFFSWILPIVLVIGAFKFQAWYIPRARAVARRGAERRQARVGGLERRA